MGKKRHGREGKSRADALAQAVGGMICFMVAMSACGPSPSGSNEVMGETIVEMSDAITSLRQGQAELQEEIDSLRAEITRQDSIVRHIANLAGMPR